MNGLHANGAGPFFRNLFLIRVHMIHILFFADLDSRSRTAQARVTISNNDAIILVIILCLNPISLTDDRVVFEAPSNISSPFTLPRPSPPNIGLPAGGAPSSCSLLIILLH